MAAMAKWLLILLALSVTGAACARDPLYMTPLGRIYGEGFASQQQTDQLVGEISVEVICPSAAASDGMQRGARITLQNSGTHWERAVVSRVLLNGMQKIGEQCYFGEEERGVGFVIGFMDILASPTAGAAPEVFFRVRQYQPMYKSWAHASSVAEENQREAARQQAVRAQEVQRQQAIEAWNRQKAADDAFWSQVWLWGKVAFFFGLAMWLFSKREVILRWYYVLTPHPATSMVEASMHRGVELDGKAFAEIMRPMPGGRIEKEVRVQQAQELAAKAHRYAEKMRAEADRIKAKAQQDTEFIKAQDELTKAATVHEQAKARLDALRKRVG